MPLHGKMLKGVKTGAKRLWSLFKGLGKRKKKPKRRTPEEMQRMNRGFMEGVESLRKGLKSQKSMKQFHKDRKRQRDTGEFPYDPRHGRGLNRYPSPAYQASTKRKKKQGLA